ncbi:MAG: hypothetical protein BGO57_11060 [Sphingomonadales bacterium 63-6]|nr:MAG: hypothetical protein BGO57_11060 [Sphingomonadales bacterium 63-6]
MRLILTALLFVGGLFFIINGLSFLAMPQSSVGSFGLDAVGAAGWSTIRADMTAFFVVGGFCMVWGAWKRAGDMLLVPAALFGIAFIGRLVSLIADGGYEGAAMPMAIEAGVVLVSIMGNRLLPHHKVEELTS